MIVYVFKMVLVYFQTYDGKKHSVDIPEGLSIMEGALQNDIAGIEADCGGACACATCHIYMDTNIEVEKPSIAEEDMLDFAFNVQENSRLSCQILVTKAMEGMTILLPEKQF